MGYGTTRISASAHGILREMSKVEGKPMLALLDEAVESLRRQRFLEQVNAAYATLRADARAWEAVENERRAWDVTLPDGLAVAEGRAPYAALPRPKRGGKRR
jgi:hypothetical protein